MVDNGDLKKKVLDKSRELKKKWEKKDRTREEVEEKITDLGDGDDNVTLTTYFEVDNFMFEVSLSVSPLKFMSVVKSTVATIKALGGKPLPSIQVEKLQLKLEKRKMREKQSHAGKRSPNA